MSKTVFINQVPCFISGILAAPYRNGEAESCNYIQYSLYLVWSIIGQGRLSPPVLSSGLAQRGLVSKKFRYDVEFLGLGPIYHAYPHGSPVFP